MTTVLIVDGAVLARHRLTHVLGSVEALEVVGAAVNGTTALRKIARSKPDVVVLNLVLPDLDGLEVLRRMGDDLKTCQVVVCVGPGVDQAAAAKQAMALGAKDHVVIAAAAYRDGTAEQTLRAELVPRLLALTGPRKRRKRVRPPSLPAPPVRRRSRIGPPIELLAIGSSTGGPQALEKVISALPADFPVPIVIVQHMPPMFTRLLAERLTKLSQLEAAEGSTGMKLEAGKIYVAPGGRHMVVGPRGAPCLKLHDEAPEHGCRPAVDPLFRSVAQHYEARCLAVVLTGMGSDGSLGAKALDAMGANVVVQDEATSVVWGMPGHVADAGIAAAVLPIDEIAADIVRRVRQSRKPRTAGKSEATKPAQILAGSVASGKSADKPPDTTDPTYLSDEDFTSIATLLRREASITLEASKKYLVIARLRALLRTSEFRCIADLMNYQRQTKDAATTRHIVEALTTNETSFFRDVRVYRALENRVLPSLIEAKKHKRELRIWSAACSNGQEPYSLAMLLRSAFPVLKDWKVSILATDIDTQALAKAESARYTKPEVNRGLPAKMLADHFRQEATSWVVRDELRAMIDFRQMNLASRWSVRGPFDLVLIRNVLIYFDEPTKRDILERAGRCLSPLGFLLLGGAESTLGVVDEYLREDIGEATAYRLKAAA